MKKTCPVCKTIVEIDETKYEKGTTATAVCQLCGETMEFDIPIDSGKDKSGSIIKPIDNKTIVSPKENLIQQPQAQVSQNTDTVPTTGITLTTSSYPNQTDEAYDEPVKGSNKTLWITLSVVLLLGIGVFGWFYYNNIYLPEKIDREAPRMYPIVNVKLRTTPVATGDYNTITSIPYGSELITYEKEGDWYSVKYIPPTPDAKPLKGYVSADYLLNKSDFYILNGIFGNRDAADVIQTSKCRFALLNYYKEKGFIGKVPEDIRTELSLPMPTDDNQWEVFLTSKEKPNQVLFPRAYNPSSKYTDFAVMLRNIRNPNEHMVVAFTFDDDTESPQVFGEIPTYEKSIADIVRQPNGSYTIYWGE